MAKTSPNFQSAMASTRRDLMNSCSSFPLKTLGNGVKALGLKHSLEVQEGFFPTKFKAGEMLLLWLKKLKSYPGFKLFTHHSLKKIEKDKSLFFDFKGQEVKVDPSKNMAVLFSLGGGSWSKTGSDGLWTDLFSNLGLKMAPFQSMNSGFETDWSPHFKKKVNWSPLKNIKLSFKDHSVRGELIFTPYGLEGGPLYELSALVRDSREKAQVLLDFFPDLSQKEVLSKIHKPRGKNSLSNHLRKKLKLSGLAFSLLKERTSKEEFKDLDLLGQKLKALPLDLLRPRPMEESISTSGGIHFDNLDNSLMIKKMPGFYVAGEMLDWEAPTGGYLLQGCFSTAYKASQSILSFLDN
ncbi:TIGR03862 family flavoprotein [Bacteriovoracales bacterium]|nr:TIGR03862 family flavoprotein [Bacteriovoracales bacterium]